MFSTTWAAQYWYLCLIALGIGVATGWWIWGRLAGAVQTAAVAPERPLTVVPEPIEADAVPEIPVELPPLRRESEVETPVGPKFDPIPRPRIAAAVGAPDDLELIKGVGPKLNTLLVSLGVTRFDQIAAWSAGDVAEVDGYLGSFKGRIDRDNWVDQAGYLARGDVQGFEARYGGLGSEKA